MPVRLAQQDTFSHVFPCLVSISYFICKPPEEGIGKKRGMEGERKRGREKVRGRGKEKEKQK